MRALGVNLPWWVLWAVLAVALVRLADRVPLGRPLKRSIPVHAAASLVFSVVHLAAASAAIRLAPDPPAAYALSLFGQIRLLAVGYIFMELVTYWALLGGYTAWVASARSRTADRERRRLEVAAAEAEAERARLEGRMVEARLQALRAELNPHFLFNSLNGVASLAQDGDVDGAVRMVARIGDLLRRTLDRDVDDVCTLEEELEIVGLYLDIERVRHGERLRVVRDVDPDALDLLVPPLLLQPLVENAVRHGVGGVERPVEVRLAARVDEGVLEVTVADSGPGLGGRQGAPSPHAGADAGDEAGGGVGLRNVRERVEALYGAGGSVEVVDAREGGAVARIRIPARRPSSPRVGAGRRPGAEAAAVAGEAAR